MFKRKKISIIGICCLLALAVIGGSLAYWNFTSEIENPFDTGKNGSTVVEDFKPDDGTDWQPGVEVNKDVYAVNTGTTDLIVRARLDETWTRKGEDVAYKDSASATDGYDVYTVEQDNPTDGLTAADKSVVTKTFSTSTNWIKGTDGWYYYKVNLAGGQTSDKWLDSVTLLSDADMGNLVTTYYVSASDDENANNWTWYEYDHEVGMPAYIDASGAPCEKDAPGARFVLHNKAETQYVLQNGIELNGYSDSDYICKVTIQTVQPTQDAINEVFGNGNTFTAPAGTSWLLK